jgi:SMI1 / KNR4 family (SUKH-1)
MTSYAWEQLLKDLSRKLIQGRDESHGWELPPELLAAEWLGYPGALEAQIVAVETRLGTKLPPAYREFLQVSNGWRNCDWTEMELWSTAAIEWFATNNQAWIDAWPPYTEARPSVPDEQYFVYGAAQDCVHLRCEYLSTALEISRDSGDGDIFLLIPDVVSAEGEWEAWHFGNKLPGAVRYRSFYELMQQVLAQGGFVA